MIIGTTLIVVLAFVQSWVEAYFFLDFLVRFVSRQNEHKLYLSAKFHCYYKNMLKITRWYLNFVNKKKLVQ